MRAYRPYPALLRVSKAKDYNHKVWGWIAGIAPVVAGTALRACLWSFHGHRKSVQGCNQGACRRPC